MPNPLFPDRDAIFLRTELPRVAQLAALCESFEDSYDAVTIEEL